MAGLSIHGVDVGRGIPAEGLTVAVYGLAPTRRLLAQARLGASGALDHPIVQARLEPGPYEVLLSIGAFFASAGIAQSEPPFLDEVCFRFAVADPDRHVHLPIKFTPWGYSLFRGS